MLFLYSMVQLIHVSNCRQSTLLRTNARRQQHQKTNSNCQIDQKNCNKNQTKLYQPKEHIQHPLIDVLIFMLV